MSARAVHDCLFLGLVVLLSLVLYVWDLGFYSDDWAFLGPLRLSPDQSFVGLFRLANTPPWVWIRPVQTFYLTALYWLFGLRPLGYHLVNAVVLVSSVVLFYVALRELGQRRVPALAVSAAYALLPHYSTDRFWIAAFQANLSMALYFLSLWADVRAVRARRSGLWGWKLLSILALLGSTLAYEVTIPLFFLNLLLIWGYSRRSRSRASTGPMSLGKWAGLLGSNLLVLVSVVVFKALVTDRLESGSGFGTHALWFLESAVGVNYGVYGLGLPVVVLKIVRQYPDPTVFAVGAGLGLIVFGYLYNVARTSKTGFPSPITVLDFVVWGLVVFGLSNALFLVARNAQHTPTGTGNRIAIAGAVGVALSLVGGIGWGSRLVPSVRLRRYVFCLLVALLCTSGFVIINTVASFWIASYRTQQEVLADIRGQLPTLPAGSTLVLDGVCPYVGPAIVFFSNADLAGALQILYRDGTLRADVVTPNLTVENDGLYTRLYETSHYPYGEALFIYHVGRKTTYQLRDATAARRYFQTFNPDHSGGCPRGEEGHGVRVLG